MGVEKLREPDYFVYVWFKRLRDPEQTYLKSQVLTEILNCER